MFPCLLLPVLSSSLCLSFFLSRSPFLMCLASLHSFSLCSFFTTMITCPVLTGFHLVLVKLPFLQYKKTCGLCFCQVVVYVPSVPSSCLSLCVFRLGFCYNPFQLVSMFWTDTLVLSLCLAKLPFVNLIIARNLLCLQPLHSGQSFSWVSGTGLKKYIYIIKIAFVHELKEKQTVFHLAYKKLFYNLFLFLPVMSVCEGGMMGVFICGPVSGTAEGYTQIASNLIINHIWKSGCSHKQITNKHCSPFTVIWSLRKAFRGVLKHKGHKGGT